MRRVSDNTNKVALVTGAGRRIGAEIAKCLHARGMRIAVHYRQSEHDALSVVEGLNAIRAESSAAFRTDLADLSEVEGLVEGVVSRFSSLDVLVNNASVFYRAGIGSTKAAAFDELIAVNLKAPYFLIQKAHQQLASSKGSVVNITDLYASRSVDGYAAYCPSKAGLESLTRSAALELAPEVRVNAVAPGAILWPEDGSEDSEILRRTPLRRLGTAREIAKTVEFLAIDATFMTGQVLAVDGGRSAVDP